MKLELKHLASYLPYGLDFKGKRKGWVSFDGSRMTLCPIDFDGRFEIIKPILRPLSDLTKEIEHKGEKFVPSEKLKEIFPNVSHWQYLTSMAHIWQQYINNLTETNIEYCVIQKLFEWHFDVFGLIEQGLAIDINTHETNIPHN